MSEKHRSWPFGLAVALACALAGIVAAVLTYFALLHPYIPVEKAMGDYYGTSVISPRWTSAYDGSTRSWLIGGQVERCYYDTDYAPQGGMLRCRDGQDEYVPMTLW